MRRTVAVMLVAAGVVGGCATTTEYQVWDDGGQVRTGGGGSKTVVGGVELWTSGAPPRPYRVIGIVRDSRGQGAFTGNAGMEAAAAKVKSVGGDAGIVMASSTETTGAIVQPMGGMAVATPVRTRTTQVQVIKWAQ